MTYPIILAHGACRFDVFWRKNLKTDNSDRAALDNLHYFKGIRTMLVDNGFSACHSSVSWAGGVEKRSEQLKNNILRIIKENNIEKVNIEEKLSCFSDYWNPRIVGELNNQHVKLVKFQGKFVWHKHDKEDEMFYVLKGEFKLEFRDKTVNLKENEFLIVPRGVEHRPVAESEVSAMVFEPCTTVNTGNNPGELTQDKLENLME